ncbi:MAG: hypothetical protein LAT61_11835 [Alcanivorax sp.]|nr:hypothetical protein [Alcanivorax sp.]
MKMPERKESTDKISLANFFLREGAPYSPDIQDENFNLPKLDSYNNFSISVSEDSHHLALETLNQWYSTNLANYSEKEWLAVFESYDHDTAYWSLLLCTHLRRYHDQKWLRLMKNLSKHWSTLPTHVFDEDTSYASEIRSPLPDDTRLWLRLEARRALWNAGEQKLAIEHDNDEPYRTFSSWQKLGANPT